MTTISAEVICHSKHSETAKEIVTLRLRYPRFIHSEFMTHRVFSRNASSSRAIPVSKLIQDVTNDPAVPLFWGKNQKGMQAGEEHDARVKRGGEDITREQAWLGARYNAVLVARAFDEAGYHKQIVNRLLEPFSHITVVVTATEWSNFFALRDHPDAEPHIRLLAQRMKTAIAASEPKILVAGEWHLPFITDQDWNWYLWRDDYSFNEALENIIKVSVARCASTSYKTVDGFDMTPDRAVTLYYKLVSSAPLHASPCEHQAYADHLDDVGDYYSPKLHGNFVGFIQYRKLIPGESS